MNPRHLLSSSALIAAAILAGCSSAPDSLTQEVSVRSTPDDATVTINGKTMDRTTNTEFVLKRDSDYVVVVSKSGYKSATARIGHLATGAETKDAPRFELTETKIAVELEEDPFAEVDALLSPVAAVAPAPVVAAATEDKTKLNDLAAEKLAAEKAEKAARAAAEADTAKAEQEAAAKVAAENKAAKEAADAVIVAEQAAETAAAKAKTEAAEQEAAAKVAAETKAAKEAEEAKMASDAKAAANAQVAKEAAEAAAAANAGEKIAELETKLSTSEKKLAAANEKIANLETQIEQANDSAERAAAAAKSVTAPVAAAKAPASSNILARYKMLREQLKTGEITKAEYDKSVAGMTR